MQKSVEFRNVIARSFPGTTLDLTVFRSGKKRSVPLELGTRPSPEELRNERYAGPDRRIFRSFGLVVEALSEDLSEALKLTSNDGTFVVTVISGSKALDAGLREGDVIVKLGDERIRNLQDVREAMQSYDRSTSISVYRGGILHKLSPSN